jgi:hypothetical protein
VPTNTVNLLLANGNQRNIMYDPSFSDANNDLLWDFNLVASGTLAQVRVTGYVPTFPDMTAYYFAFSHMVISNVNFKFTQTSIRVSSAGATASAPPPTDRMLVSCAILSAGDNFGNLAADGFNAAIGFGGGKNTTSHLNGLLPAGGNQCMLDNHVEWHRFALGTTLIRSQIPGVYFWW